MSVCVCLNFACVVRNTCPHKMHGEYSFFFFLPLVRCIDLICFIRVKRSDSLLETSSLPLGPEMKKKKKKILLCQSMFLIFFFVPFIANSSLETTSEHSLHSLRSGNGKDKRRQAEQVSRGTVGFYFGQAATGC